MDTAFAELPLALFTTLAPVGAGAFVALAVAFLSTEFTSEQIKRTDKATLIPIVVILLGFGASFIHLASPLHAPFVFYGVGTSPLSNEILAGSVFVVVALIYEILALSGKLGMAARKALVSVVAVLALIFACFTALAYMMQTIVSWNSPLLVVQMLGFTVAGGMALGSFVLVLGGSFVHALKGGFKNSALALSIVGTLVGCAAFGAQMTGVAALGNPLLDGATLVDEVCIWIVVALLCLILSAVAEVCALLKRNPLVLTGLATILVLVGIFVARLVFYVLQLSVGLSIS